jgi:hypothetical protein
MATLAGNDDGVIWFEIDRSARGSSRLNDLKILVDKLGTAVTMGEGETRVLRKVVILCKTPSILRRNRTHLLGCATDEPSLIEREPGCLDYYRWLGVRSGKRVHKELTVVGQVHLQLLPMHLSSYSYKDGAAHGWFDDGSLPFRDPDGAWPEPIPLEQH